MRLPRGTLPCPSLKGGDDHVRLLRGTLAFRTNSSGATLPLVVRLVAAVLAAGALNLAACGGVPASGSLLTPVQLKYRLLEQVGPIAYCDRDQYPLAREVTPDYVDQQLAYIRAHDPQTYQAILDHYHLSAPATDQQKLEVYNDYKQLTALQLQADGDGYDFSYGVPQGADKGSIRVTGTIDRVGSITIQSRTQFRLMCPICLAASTLIDTPAGQVPVTSLRPGMAVWTRDVAGQRQAGVVLEVGSTPAPAGHAVVQLVLADGRQVWVSPGHPTADGRRVGDLLPGQLFDGSRVVLADRVPYSGSTYDLLPSGPTGAYWADGVLLVSTLKA